MTRLLIVDDEILLTDILEIHFLDAGYDVVTCNSGRDAFEQLQGDIDLLLCDIRMPTVSGDQVIKHCTETKTIPILAMTGFSDFSSYELRHMGVRDIVRKPFEPVDIIDKVERALQCPFTTATNLNVAVSSDLATESQSITWGRHGFFLPHSEKTFEKDQIVEFTATYGDKNQNLRGYAKILYKFLHHPEIEDGLMLEFIQLNEGGDEYPSFAEEAKITASIPLLKKEAFRETG